MIKNSLKLALRNIRKNKAATFINLLGLFIGITCCLIIYAKIQYEQSFDTFHSDTERIYRKVRLTSGLEYLRGKLEYRAGTFFAFPFAIREEIPEVEIVTPVFRWSNILIKVPEEGNKQEKLFQVEKELALVEPEFFQLFDFKGKPLNWLHGNPETSLNEPYSMVLTKDMAEKYFPNGEAMGQTISINGIDGVKITGIIEKMPNNTNFPFTHFGSFSTFTTLQKGIETRWVGLADFYQCYIKLKSGVSVAAVEQKLKAMHGQHRDNNMVDERIFNLQPLAELHTDENFRGHNFNNSFFSNKVKVTMLAIALFLLIILSVNYSNLAISISARRAKEVAVRKISGSTRRFIMFQFLGESFVVISIALILGILATVVIVSQFENFFGFPQGFSWHLTPASLGVMLVLLILLSIFSGGYPALIVSGLKPVSVLRKGSSSLFSGRKNFSVPSLLIQFVIAQVMIIAALAVYKQMFFINHTDIGYNRNGIIYVDLPNSNRNNAVRFKQLLEQNPAVQMASLASSIPAVSGNFNDITYDGHDELKVALSVIKLVDEDYIDTYGMQLLYGRKLEPGDSTGNVLVNEQLLKELELPVNEQSIGKVVRFNGRRKAVISGIVKDFHANSFHENIRPSMLIYSPSYHGVASLKFVVPKDNSYTYLSDLVKYVKTSWEDIYKDEAIFSYQFLDDYIAQYYTDEKRFTQLVSLFTILIIVICCMGIVGLSYYNIKKKNKEIAVRKVSGANTANVLSVFSSGYVKLVFVSFIISVPLAYFSVEKWLQNFAYRTEISWWLFLVAVSVAALVAVATITMQSWNAARRNPVEALRYE